MTKLRDPEPCGVLCPVCQSDKSKVLEARRGPGYVRRRHLCLSAACEHVTAEKRIAGRAVVVVGTRWTTYQFFSPRRGAIAVPRDTRAIRGIVERAS